MGTDTRRCESGPGLCGGGGSAAHEFVGLPAGARVSSGPHRSWHEHRPTAGWLLRRQRAKSLGRSGWMALRQPQVSDVRQVSQRRFSVRETSRSRSQRRTANEKLAKRFCLRCPRGQAALCDAMCKSAAPIRAADVAFQSPIHCKHLAADGPTPVRKSWDDAKKRPVRRHPRGPVRHVRLPSLPVDGTGEAVEEECLGAGESDGAEEGDGARLGSGDVSRPECAEGGDPFVVGRADQHVRWVVCVHL